MRLIDADRIEVRIPACLNGSQMKHVAECIKESLHNAPTVDAIPIEWLKEWSRLYLEPTKEYTDIIEDIIRDYREEQSNEGQGSC